MTKIRGWTATFSLAALAWAPALAAQRAGPPAERGPGAGRGVVAVVERALEHRGALELTDAQVARLEAIRNETRADMDPLRERMRALRDSALERRGALRERAEAEDVDRDALRREARDARRGQVDALRELRLEMRGLQRERARAFRETITAEQMLRLRRLAGDARGGMGRARPGDGADALRGRPGRSDAREGRLGRGSRAQGRPGPEGMGPRGPRGDGPGRGERGGRVRSPGGPGGTEGAPAPSGPAAAPGA